MTCGPRSSAGSLTRSNQWQRMRVSVPEGDAEGAAERFQYLAERGSKITAFEQAHSSSSLTNCPIRARGKAVKNSSFLAVSPQMALFCKFSSRTILSTLRLLILVSFSVSTGPLDIGPRCLRDVYIHVHDLRSRHVLPGAFCLESFQFVQQF